MKLRTKIILLSICLVLLAGVITLIVLLPKNNTDEPPAPPAEYTVTCDFKSLSIDYSDIEKVTDSPISGDNIYQVKYEGDVVAYLDSGKHVIFTSIVEGTTINLKVYIANLIEVEIKLNDTPLTLTPETNDFYNVYSIQHEVKSDVKIEVIGELLMLV